MLWASSKPYGSWLVYGFWTRVWPPRCLRLLKPTPGLCQASNNKAVTMVQGRHNHRHNNNSNYAITTICLRLSFCPDSLDSTPAVGEETEAEVEPADCQVQPPRILTCCLGSAPRGQTQFNSDISPSRLVTVPNLRPQGFPTAPRKETAGSTGNWVQTTTPFSLCAQGALVAHAPEAT